MFPPVFGVDPSLAERKQFGQWPSASSSWMKCKTGRAAIFQKHVCFFTHAASLGKGHPVGEEGVDRKEETGATCVQPQT